MLHHRPDGRGRKANAPLAARGDHGSARPGLSAVAEERGRDRAELIGPRSAGAGDRRMRRIEGSNRLRTIVGSELEAAPVHPALRGVRDAFEHDARQLAAKLERVFAFVRGSDRARRTQSAACL